MKIKNKECYKLSDRKVYVILFSIFILNIVIRSILALKFSDLSVFPDELLHWNISKSIAENGKVIYRNINIGYSEILYSIVISIAHISSDTEVAYKIAKVINCILMSSAIFPIYLMAMKILKNKKISLLIAIIGIIVPEMTYTLKIMQENLYYPMFMWFWFIIITMIYDNKFSNRNIILLALYVFFMTICKQMGLNVFVGIVIYYIVITFLYKKNYKRNLIQLFLFIISFMIIKNIYISIFNIVNNTGNTITDSVISQIIHNILNKSILVKLIYPLLDYVVMIIISFGVYTVILPFSLFSKLEDKQQKLLIIIIAIIFSTIGVICFQILPAENLGETVIRVHLRYIYYMFIPLFILFYSCSKKVEEVGVNKLGILLLFNLIIMISLINVLPKYVSVDGPTLTILGTVEKLDAISISVKMILIFAITALGYLLYNEKVKIFYRSIVVILIVNSLVNTVAFCKSENIGRKNFNETKNEAIQMNNYLEQNLKENSKIVILATDEYAEGNLEGHLSVPYYLILKNDFYNNIINGNKIEFNNMQLVTFSKSCKNDQFSEPDYIICKNYIGINGYDLVDIGLKDYKLYRKNGGNISMKYITNGIYDDNWIGKESGIEIYDDSDKKEIEVQLKIETSHFQEDIIKCRDNDGDLPDLKVTNNRNNYSIKLKRNNNEPFKLNMTSDQTFKPEGGDERNLSVRILDINIK